MSQKCQILPIEDFTMASKDGEWEQNAPFDVLETCVVEPEPETTEVIETIRKIGDGLHADIYLA